MFYILFCLNVFLDIKTDKKYTFLFFLSGLILFSVYSVFVIYKDINCVDQKQYNDLVEELDKSIENKIKDNYNEDVDKEINDKIGYRERKLNFIKEFLNPINKQEDVLTGIIALFQVLYL